MIENVYLSAGVLIWGIALGVCYFGGLWFTVRHLGNINHQALWMISSFFIRNLLIIAGFYPIVLQGWQPVIICLIGFTAVRFVLTRLIKVPSS